MNNIAERIGTITLIAFVSAAIVMGSVRSYQTAAEIIADFTRTPEQKAQLIAEREAKKQDKEAWDAIHDYVMSRISNEKRYECLNKGTNEEIRACFKQNTQDFVNYYHSASDAEKARLEVDFHSEPPAKEDYWDWVCRIKHQHTSPVKQ